MRYGIFDTQYRFVSSFDSTTGTYVRSGIIDDNGLDTGVDPFMASFPHLIDVGVMGRCEHGNSGLCLKAGIGCYQSGATVEQPNMTADDFEWIARQCRHRTNQLALGGRGDPDQHEEFERLLRIARENDLAPNFTTSGYGMTDKIAEVCKRYCGAVAVSWYRSEYTYAAIRMLLAAEVKTNVHYVLGKNSIDEAIRRLRNDDFPEGLNAVVFLLHKPAGHGTWQNVLEPDDPRLHDFFEQVDTEHRFKVGLDSCTVPGALNRCHSVLRESLDTCEGGRFSCYIGPDMSMVPCSFDQTGRYQVQLGGPGRPGPSILEAWNSARFNAFRRCLRMACPGCVDRDACMGGCPLVPGIVLCNRDDRVVQMEAK